MRKPESKGKKKGGGCERRRTEAMKQVDARSSCPRWRIYEQGPRARRQLPWWMRDKWRKTCRFKWQPPPPLPRAAGPDPSRERYDAVKGPKTVGETLDRVFGVWRDHTGGGNRRRLCWCRSRQKCSQGCVQSRVLWSSLAQKKGWVKRSRWNKNICRGTVCFLGGWGLEGGIGFWCFHKRVGLLRGKAQPRILLLPTPKTLKPQGHRVLHFL